MRGKSVATLALREAAKEILEAIQPASVRACCYKLFAQGFIPNMSRNSTNRVGRILRDAREEYEIPWAWIVDETSEAERPWTFAHPEQFVRSYQDKYAKDRWQTQTHTVEVWSEKGTIRGTIAPVLKEYGVTFRVFHGFGSATTLHEIAEESAFEDDYIALYIGDWDPSGLYMSDVDIPGRLFKYEGNVAVERIALRAEDLPGLNGFPLAEKQADSRARWYHQTTRMSTCWEVDAMDPRDLRQRVAEEIGNYIEWEAWNRCAVGERAVQDSLKLYLGNWAKFVKTLPE